MSKSILVIDTPTRCSECKLLDFGKCWGSASYIPLSTKDKPKECPLRSLPKREKANKGSSGEFKAIDEAWTQGFNDCLAEITGETE